MAAPLRGRVHGRGDAHLELAGKTTPTFWTVTRISMACAGGCPSPGAAGGACGSGRAMGAPGSADNAPNRIVTRSTMYTTSFTNLQPKQLVIPNEDRLIYPDGLQQGMQALEHTGKHRCHIAIAQFNWINYFNLLYICFNKPNLNVI